MHGTATIDERTAHSSAIRLRLLGGFELSVDDEPVDLQPAVQRLTAFVALTPRGVSRMFAAFQLWPDKSEQRALANLRSTLWRLKQLAVDVVVVGPTRLSLARSVWLDIRSGHGDHEHDPVSDLVPAPFQTMLLDLLPDWYDDWLVVERERYRQLQLATLESQARAAIRAGDSNTAIQLALSALAIDGTRESAHQLVVDAHIAEGNEWEARREHVRYQDCVARTVA